MISTRSRNSFDQMFIAGIKASTGGSAPDACVVEVVPDLNGIKETSLVVVTVASFVFRLSVFIYFTPDEATRRHFVPSDSENSETSKDQVFFDAIRECGNICCGTLNRELARVFPHVAMSTPNIVVRECGNYLEALNGGHLQHFRSLTEDGKQFFATLCVRDYADIDFEWAMAEEETASGEMEFF
jgi:hypothetical protein